MDGGRYIKTEMVVRCLKCGVKNRIGRENMRKKAACGSCSASLEEIIISCLHCGKKNRVGDGQAHEGVLRCGACGEPLIDEKGAPS